MDGPARVWGLTGKYCAGKNQAGRILEQAGCLVVDVDKLGHRVLEESKPALIARFGPEVLDTEEKVNRRVLGQKVFNNPRALKELEAIVHPGAIHLTRRIILENPGRIVVINAALLFPSGIYQDCSRVLWINSPLTARIHRALSRDGLTLGAVFSRIWAQRKLSFNYWKKYADIEVVSNAGTEQDLALKLGDFLNRFGS
jgi:dephospho-CoA kinase